MFIENDLATGSLLIERYSSHAAWTLALAIDLGCMSIVDAVGQR
jgi:hypothetical protein